jgi:hypothetical protein
VLCLDVPGELVLHPSIVQGGRFFFLFVVDRIVLLIQKEGVGGGLLYTVSLTSCMPHCRLGGN